MTYGPPPGWNPNQPQAGPVGGQPGYPQQPGYPPQQGYPQQPGPQQTGPQPGYQQPTGPQPAGQQPAGSPPMGQPMSGQPMPGQAMPGQAPMGQFAPAYGAPPGPPPSPLPVIAGLLALVGFLYLAYTTVVTILAMTATGLSNDIAMSRLVYNTSFVMNPAKVWSNYLRYAGWLVTALFLVGLILLFARRPAGRVLGIMAAALAIIIALIQVILLPAWYVNLFVFIFPIVPLALIVLCLLPATGKAMRRRQQAGYQPIGYAPPPGGYQQPPGGMPR